MMTEVMLRERLGELLPEGVAPTFRAVALAQAHIM
jgi:hypothetical protein